MATITAKTGTRDFVTDTDWVGDVAPGIGDDYVIPSGCDMTADAIIDEDIIALNGVVAAGGILRIINGGKNAGVITGGGDVIFYASGALNLGTVSVLNVTFDTGGNDTTGVVNADIVLFDNGSYNYGEVTATTSVTFDEASYTNSDSVIEAPDVIFDNNSVNGGSVDADAGVLFYGSENIGSVVAISVAFDKDGSDRTAKNSTGGTIEADGVTLANSSQNNTTITANSILFDSGSYNDASGTLVTPEVEFDQASYNSGNIDLTAIEAETSITLLGGSYNNATGSLAADNVTFEGSGTENGATATVAATTVTFDTGAVNNGAITAVSIVFQAGSDNSGTATIDVSATFDASTNNGTVSAPTIVFQNASGNAGNVAASESLVFLDTSEATITMITLDPGVKFYCEGGFNKLTAGLDDNSGLPLTNDLPTAENVRSQIPYAAGELVGELSSGKSKPSHTILGNPL